MDVVVTVVVPMYNAEHTIQSCVESIIYQSYKNVELIVVDDGSTDNSAKLVKRYGSNINYIYQNNSGVSVARNNGMALATGDYLLFVDSDDYIDKNFVEKIVEFAQRYDLDMTVAGHAEENTTIYGGNKNEGEEFVATCDNDVVNRFTRIHVGQAVGKLYRTSILKRNKIVFPCNMSLAEDFYFVCELLCHTNKIGFVGDTCYRIRNVNSSSLSKRYVNNISVGINMQLEIWEKLSSKYTGLDIAYAEGDMDYKLHKIKMYANNLFRKGSPVSFRESIGMIDSFVSENPKLLVGNIPIRYYPNVIRKTESLIIKSRQAWLISLFYYSKEKLKHRKYKSL